MSERVVVDDISFRIVHYVIDPTYTSVSFDWASPEIGGRVVEKLANASKGDRFQLLSDMLKHKHLLKMRCGRCGATCRWQVMNRAVLGRLRFESGGWV